MSDGLDHEDGVAPVDSGQGVAEADRGSGGDAGSQFEHVPLPAAAGQRNAAGADLSPVFSLDAPRDPDGWPVVSPRPVPPYTGKIAAPDAALRGLGKAAFHACAALATHFGKPSPAVTQDEDLTRADGAALMNDLVGDVFVRLPGR